MGEECENSDEKKKGRFEFKISGFGFKIWNLGLKTSPTQGIEEVAASHKS